MITLTPELPLAFVFEYINFMYTETHNDIMDASDHPIEPQTYQQNAKLNLSSRFSESTIASWQHRT